MKHKYSLFSRKSLRVISIIAGSMTFAFFAGVHSAGDIQPLVEPTQATSERLPGDMNDDAVVTAADLRIVLEAVNGYRAPTASEIAGDPNHDMRLTTDDALAIVSILEGK